MEVQPNTEHVLRHSRGATVAPPVDGRITYIGKPFPQWVEIKRNLSERNLDVHDCGDPRAPMTAAEVALTDLVVVGESDGLRESHEICRDLRRNGFRGPILLLTGADDLIGRILGLESGADAWCAADRDSRSSVAQIRALIRRKQYTSAAEPAANKLRAGKFALNAASREVAIGMQRIDLSTLEFELLWHLASNAGEILPRERLAGLVGYDAEAVEGRAIDTAVSRLRHHLGQPHAAQIRTIRGVGYMLCVQSMFEPSWQDPHEHAQ